MKNWGMLAIAATAITFGSSLAMPDVAQADELGVACGTYAQNRKITRGEILARSRTWLTARVPYSQTTCFGNKYGAYRTDCSGFVSMAWGLRVSYTTHILEQVAHRIEWDELRPGDALNDRLNHVALFIGWADSAKTRPIVREQAGPNGSKPVQRVWSAATARQYVPLRYNGLVEGTAIPDTAPITVDAPVALAGPQLSNTANGSLDVYARAADGTLVRNFHKTSRWNGWEQLGAERFAGDPVALLNPETKAAHVYVRGTDGKIYGRTGDAAWAPLGDTTLAGDPVVGWNASTKTVDVFARSYEGKLMRFSNNAWAEVGARGVVGNASVVWNTETKTLEVYARSADDKLLRAVDKDWEQVGDGAITSDPAAVMAGKTVEVYARDADGVVAQIVAGTHKKMGGGKIKGAPNAVWNSGANAVDVVAWSESGLIEYQRTGGTAWTKLGTQVVSKAPTAMYHAQTKTLEVFSRDNDGRQVRRFMKEKTGWSPWSSLGDQQLAR